MASRILHIANSSVSTEIVTESGSLKRAGAMLGASSRVSQVLLISDETVFDLYGKDAIGSFAGVLPVSTFIIRPGEASKSVTSAEQTYNRLAELNFNRDGLVVALGGGVVSDLAGFAAATWARGVPWAICPTTLEAIIDAAIGGKTAVNIPGGKNLVGAFHHPRMVLIDPDCLATLPDRDLRAGLAESVKHAAIFSEEFFAWHERHDQAILRRDPQILLELIWRNVAIKADVVEKDAAEQSGHRMLLNFGHTLGHAIEECCGFSLRHGECVALGMVAAARLSHAVGLLDSTAIPRLMALLNRLQLPTALPTAIGWPKILGALRRDKKVKGGRLQFVLLTDIGHPTVRNDLDEGAIRTAFESLAR